MVWTTDVVFARRRTRRSSEGVRRQRNTRFRLGTVSNVFSGPRCIGLLSFRLDPDRLALIVDLKLASVAVPGAGLLELATS
jgi:hypothetical protein